MNPDEKLAFISKSMTDVGLNALVMGGHAVRYYGVTRNTSDFDMVISVESSALIRGLLPNIPLLSSLKEIPGWRNEDFIRFEIGVLPDGRQELLEFWIRNHLLPDFSELRSRAEVGIYGGASVSFISLDDLIRSKETERESDWQDIALLEEIRDARLLVNARDSAGLINFHNTWINFWGALQGIEQLTTNALLQNTSLVIQAIENCQHPVTFAMLSPISPDTVPMNLSQALEANAMSALAKAEFMSGIHLGIVEVARRGYKRQAMEKDRLDKLAKVEFLRNST